MHLRKYILGLFLALNLLTVYNPIFASYSFAQVGNASPDNVANPATTPEYKGGAASIKQYLCAPTEVGGATDGRNSDLYDCVNKLYRFAIAIGAAVSVLMFVIAGYLYMTGEQKAIEQAKSFVASTLIGMGLLLSTYIILQQINPELIKFKPIQIDLSGVDAPTLKTLAELELHNPDSIIPPNITVPSGQRATKGGDPYYADDCNKNPGACPDLRGKISCQECRFQQAFANELLKLQAATKDVVKWTVTEGWPPSSTHSNPCHSTGACADIDIIGYSKAEEPAAFVKLCEAIRTKTSIGIFNEVLDVKTSSTESACGPAYNTKYHKGDHLHIFRTGS